MGMVTAYHTTVLTMPRLTLEMKKQRLLSKERLRLYKLVQ